MFASYKKNPLIGQDLSGDVGTAVMAGRESDDEGIIHGIHRDPPEEPYDSWIHEQLQVCCIAGSNRKINIVEKI